MRISRWMTMTWRWSDAGNNLPGHLVSDSHCIRCDSDAETRCIVCVLYRTISRFLFPVRPAPVIVSVMSDDHFLCFLLWWWQSGGAFHPSAGVATTSVQWTHYSYLNSVYSVYSVHRVVTSLLSCRPPRRLPPSPAPHLTVSLSVWGCGGLGWAEHSEHPNHT